MIVVVGGIKGGSGKSLIASNLAAMRSATGKKVLLVDADEQKTVTDWMVQRESSSVKTPLTLIQLSGKSLNTQLIKIKQDYDDIVIDVGGRDTTSQRSALTVADILIAPFRPRSADLWTLDGLTTVINEMRIANEKFKSYGVINQADPMGSDNKDAAELMKDYPELERYPKTIGLRKAFSNAFGEGLSVLEYDGSGEGFKKAQREMQDLYDHIYSI